MNEIVPAKVKSLWFHACVVSEFGELSLIKNSHIALNETNEIFVFGADVRGITSFRLVCEFTLEVSPVSF